MKIILFILFILVGCNPFEVHKKTSTIKVREIASIETDKFINLKFFGGTVSSIIEDGKGGLFVSGDFDKVSDKKGIFKSRKIVHVFKNGLIDRRFKVAFKKDYESQVRAMLWDGEYLYIAGNFKYIKNKKIQNITRVHFNGDRDKNWSVENNLDIFDLIKKDNDLYLFGHENHRPFIGKVDTKLKRLKIEKVLDFLDVEGSVYSAIFVDDQFFIGGDFNLTINKKVAQHVAGLSSDFKKITFNPNVSYSTGKPIVKRVFYEPSYKRLFFVGRFNYVEKQLRVNAVAFKAEKEFILEPQFTPIGFNNSIDSINVNKDLNYLFLGGTFTIANREAHKGLFAFDYKTLQPIPKEKFKAVVDYSYGDPKVNIIHKWGESVLFGGQFSSVNSISGPYFNLFDLNSCHKCFF